MPLHSSQGGCHVIIKRNSILIKIKTGSGALRICRLSADIVTNGKKRVAIARKPVTVCRMGNLVIKSSGMLTSR
jgi:hypothetical protein